MRPASRPRKLAALAAALGLGVLLGACGSNSAAGTGGGIGSSAPSTTAGPSSTSSTPTTTVPPTTTTSPDAIPQPSAAHPLTMLEIGDSLGEDLGFGLGDLYADDPWVHVVQAAVGDTGLANQAYFNWPAKLETLLQQYHPGVLVVFLGANDGQGFWYDGQLAEVGNAVWHTGYSARVAEMMSEATAAGTKVMWVGMPIMQDPGFWQEMETMNAVYSAEAATHPGVTYFDSAPVFENAAGQYTASIEEDGQEVLLRDPDGVHIANGGDDRLAFSLIAPMEKAWGVQLFPPGRQPSAPAV